jgi:hypothetical protein
MERYMKINKLHKICEEQGKESEMQTKKKKLYTRGKGVFLILFSFQDERKGFVLLSFLFVR